MRKPVRTTVAIGPLNTASQATSWADTLRAELAVEAFSFAQFGYVARRFQSKLTSGPDRSIPHGRISPRHYRTARIRQLLGRTTHILNESNAAVLDAIGVKSFTAELPHIRDMGISPAMVFHGSDVRDPTTHIAAVANSYFLDLPDDYVRRLSEITQRNRIDAARAGIPTFVTTPDLCFDLPDATWLPTVVHRELLETSISPVPTTRKLRVAHLPSNRAIKGSKHIEPVLEHLENRRLIDWVKSEQLPHSDVKTFLSHCDVIVDQLQTGSYGVLAIEALALGKIVIGSLSPFVRDSTAGTVPIVEATPNTLQHVLEELIASPDWVTAVSAEGRPFVERWHSSSAVAKQLAPWLSASEGE